MIQLHVRADVLPDRLSVEYQVANDSSSPIYLANRFGQHPCSVAPQVGSENSANTWLLSTGELLIHQGWSLVPNLGPLVSAPFQWLNPAMTPVPAAATVHSTLSLLTPIAAYSGQGIRNPQHPAPPFVTKSTRRFRFAIDVLSPPPNTEQIELDGSDAVLLPADCWEHYQTRLTFAGELPKAIHVESSPWPHNTPDGDRHAAMIDAGRSIVAERTGAHLPFWR